METIIFLVILASVVAVVVYLMRHRDVAPTPVRVVPVVVEQPAVVEAAPAAPVEVEAVATVPVPPPPIVEPKVVAVIPAPAPSVVELAETPKPRRERKKPAIMTEATQPTASSVAVALSMLKQRDSLAAAFVLREIFDAPVSRRRR